VDYSTLLRLMAAELDLPGFAPEAERPCALALAGMPVTFLPHPDGQSFSMRCRVGLLDDEARFDALAGRLLAANLGPASPDGSAFSADGNGTVYLTRCLALADLGPQPLAEAVRLLAGRALHWASELAVPPAGPAGVAPFLAPGREAA
jgi:hypothetical protein